MTTEPSKQMLCFWSCFVLFIYHGYLVTICKTAPLLMDSRVSPLKHTSPAMRYGSWCVLAVRDDIKRQAVDAAKKRAVGQHVDYDTFKNMVAVAHLRPLQDPSSTQTVSHAPAWRFAPNGLLAKSADSLTLRIATFDPQTSPVPSTTDEFIRIWNRQCPTSSDKLRLLSSCGPDHICKLFRAALPADLLSSILVTLCSLHNPASGSTGVPAVPSSNMQKQEVAYMQSAQAEVVMPGSLPSAESCSNAEFIFDMLHGLSGAGRFALTVRLISQSARKAAVKLSGTLQQAENAHSGTISYSADQLHQLQRDLGMYSSNS
ncbi:hypothetical protein WJX77_010955 [Trebouxia sp. C0004]